MMIYQTNTMPNLKKLPADALISPTLWVDSMARSRFRDAQTYTENLVSKGQKDLNFDILVEINSLLRGKKVNGYREKEVFEQSRGRNYTPANQVPGRMGKWFWDLGHAQGDAYAIADKYAKQLKLIQPFDECNTREAMVIRGLLEDTLDSLDKEQAL